MMRRWFAGCGLVASLVVCGVLAGCGEEAGKQRRKGTKSSRSDTEKPGASVELTELASTGWGKVTGKLINPSPPAMPVIIGSTDKNVCERGAEFEKREQTWIVGSDGGVANVIGWVNPPPGKFFKIKDDLKKRANARLHHPQ